MTDRSADVVVVGLGPGGEALAERLAHQGSDVIGIERELVGGECPYWGCIPTKMMVRAADALAEARRIDRLAGRATVDADFGPVARRIREEGTDNWDDRVAVERFEAAGGHFVRGEARLDGPGAVVVGGDRITARQAIVLNVGTRPTIPPIPGLADVDAWTNREAVATEQAPSSLAVLGAWVRTCQ